MPEQTTNQIQAEQLPPQTVGLLTRFKEKATEFMGALTALNNIQNVPPNLQDEYLDLRSTADSIQKTISWITSTVDSVTGFFSDVFSFDGVSATREYINGNTSQLGIIPLLPLAAISGAVALMSKFIADVYLFERKVTEQKRLVASGISEAEAADIVDQISGKGITANLAEIAKPLGFGLGMFLLFRLIKGGKK